MPFSSKQNLDVQLCMILGLIWIASNKCYHCLEFDYRFNIALNIDDVMSTQYMYINMAFFIEEFEKHISELVLVSNFTLATATLRLQSAGFKLLDIV